MLRSTFTLAFLALTACGSGEATLETPTPLVGAIPLGPSMLEDANHATGSTAMVADVARGRVLTVHPDAGTLSVIDTTTNETFEVHVGGEPTRVAMAAGRVFVTNRLDRTVVALDASDLAAGVQQSARVGAEPFGVVAREDGQRLFVAASQDNVVVELDATTLEVVHRHSVGHEPRYLALHPSGGTLFVGSGRGEARITAVDLQDGSQALVDLPNTQRRGPDGEFFDLVPRLTGDLWVTADGGQLLAPVLYLDNVTPIADLSIEETEPVPTVPPEGVEGYGGGGGDVVDKFTPAVVEVAVGPTGEAGTESRALFISTTVFEPDFFTVGSYLSNVRSSPTDHTLLVTMEGTDAAVLVDPTSEVFPLFADFGVPPNGDSSIESFPTLPDEAGFFAPALAPVLGGAGTDAAVWSGGRIYLRNRIDESVSRVDEVMVRGLLDENAFSEMNMGMAMFADETVSLGASDLPADIRNGRKLFFSARERSMGAGGISCATCHFEGRNDGITWTFEGGPRQTPSLAGVVSETTPVTWTSGVASVAREAELTTIGRMGGEGLSELELGQIAAFVDWTRLPEKPTVALDSAAVGRGRQIFERADVGCSSCHAGDRRTNNASYTIRGVEDLNTPPLTGIAASAPYLHDGSAATLREVLEWAGDGVMGSTSSLIESELDDLEVYLLSL